MLNKIHCVRMKFCDIWLIHSSSVAQKNARNNRSWISRIIFSTKPAFPRQCPASRGDKVAGEHERHVCSTSTDSLGWVVAPRSPYPNRLKARDERRRSPCGWRSQKGETPQVASIVVMSSRRAFIAATRPFRRHCFFLPAR